MKGRERDGREGVGKDGKGEGVRGREGEEGGERDRGGLDLDISPEAPDFLVTSLVTRSCPFLLQV